MVFVETSLFSKLLGGYLNDEDYRLFQKHLVEQPEAGDIIRGSAAFEKSGGVLAARASPAECG